MFGKLLKTTFSFDNTLRQEAGDSPVSVNGEIEVRADDTDSITDDVESDMRELQRELAEAIDETLEDWQEGEP